MSISSWINIIVSSSRRAFFYFPRNTFSGLSCPVCLDPILRPGIKPVLVTSLVSLSSVCSVKDVGEVTNRQDLVGRLSASAAPIREALYALKLLQFLDLCGMLLYNFLIWLVIVPSSIRSHQAETLHVRRFAFMNFTLPCPNQYPGSLHSAYGLCPLPSFEGQVSNIRHVLSCIVRNLGRSPELKEGYYLKYTQHKMYQVSFSEPTQSETLKKSH